MAFYVDAISRTALLEKLPKDTQLLRYQVVDAIMEAPMIDPETPIVRCKDCVKHKTGLCPMYRAFPEQMDFSTENGFCHRALKRT